MKKPQNRMATNRRTRIEATKETREEHRRNQWAGAAVDMNSGRCPNCGSTRNKIEKTYPAIKIDTGAVVRRVHDCANCPTRFHTVQEIPPCDIPQYRMETE
jgi:ribosomal protein S27AE